MAARPRTLGELRAGGWASMPVRREMRRNAVARIRAGRPMFHGVLGYESTVMPQVENALIAGHDMIFLGERGQAKTRMIRSLTGLLDEWLPVVAGSEINDDPYAPVSAAARALVAERGDGTPVAWIHRDDRFGEKLATPDTSIADLIGEVDPIRVAEGRYLSDELTLHYGLVPRTNRGIFAINELPDLAERIQVGLLSVLEERDVQIRGYKVRLPLDVVLVASANPEDYTNRGRIITPLKDRFGARIRTHYPLDAETEAAIVAQEADPLVGRARPRAAAGDVGGPGAGDAAPAAGDAAPAAGDDGGAGNDLGGLAVTVPSFMTEIVVRLTHEARASSQVSQRSGVSVRLSISNHETMVANAARRTLRAGGGHVVPRVSDLEALAASTSGKVEIETLEEGRDAEVLQRLLRSAVLAVFRDRVPPATHRAVVDAFDEALVVDVGEDVDDAAYAEMLRRVPELAAPVAALLAADLQTADAERPRAVSPEDDPPRAAPLDRGSSAAVSPEPPCPEPAYAEPPALVASAVELVLEGLHLSRRLNKDSVGARAQFRARPRRRIR